MLLLELGRWSLESEEGKMVLEYVKAMWVGVPNKLAVENGFNNLRDNDGRGGRHKARSEPVLQGLTLSSM